LVLIISGELISAQEQSFRVDIDRENIVIGEQVRMTITLKCHAADSTVFPLIGDTLIREIEVVSKSKIDTAFSGDQLDQKILSQNIVLTSFDSGYYAIAPLVAHINDEMVESNPFLISVQTIAIDTAKGIYDIRGIADVPFSLKEWLKEYWPWIVFPLIALAAILYFILIWSKRPTLKSEPKPKVIRPFHEIALERLDKLEQEKLWQSGQIKLFYIELSDILREYIEHRFNIPAMEQTTDEIITSMRRSPDFSHEQIDKTRRLLFLSDLVKFAKEKPVGSENEMNIAMVRAFIIESKLDVNEPKLEQENG
jgi:hypothetical protein